MRNLERAQRRKRGGRQLREKGLEQSRFRSVTGLHARRGYAD